MRNRSRLVWATIAVVVVAGVYFAWTAFSPAEPAAPQLLVNEVLYLPDSDRPALVEIVNAGRAHTNLDGVSLRNEKGAAFALPAGIALDAGMFVVVRFDGLTGSEGGVVHAPMDAFLAGDRGAIWLTTADGAIDGVVWGVNRPGAVELCRGGRCSDPTPGSVVARIPGETAALTTTAWAPLDSENATPGYANPMPPVASFAVLSGTIYSGKPRFSWYSVPGAVRYRVEAATDEAFANRVHKADLSAASLGVLQQLTVTGPELPSGDYFWRVQANGVRGDTAAFSPPVAFSVRANKRGSRSAYTLSLIGNAYADADAPPAGGAADPNAVCPGVMSASADAICKELPVPVIVHQKDTRMLTLEAPNEEPPMGWDKPDAAGYPYCARAGVAMVNAYYRAKQNIPGTLSQDRLGYHAFKDLHPYGGPEYDLPVTGTADFRVSELLLPLALGTEGVFVRNPYISNNLNPHTFDQNACMAHATEITLQHCVEMGWDTASEECRNYQASEGPGMECPSEIAHAWGHDVIANVRREIDAERPMIVTTSTHLFLIVGYAQQGDRFFVVDQDANGRTITPVNPSGISRAFVSYWSGLAPVKVGSDEPSISADSDGDGVVDFDEEERFETKLGEADSDGDGVNDKEEIRYSVWDPDHGYHKSFIDFSEIYNERPVVAAAGQALRGPMEIWKDSDDGGCNDGKENANANGVRDAGETSNFVKEDDDCGPPPLGGHVHIDYTYNTSCTGQVSIDARFTLNPQIVPTAPGIVTTFTADAMTYDIRTDGCADVPGDHIVYTFDQGFHLSGTMPLTADNLGYAVFTPSWPHFGMQLPYVLTEIGAANSLKGSYRGVTGGGPWPADTYVQFEPLTIQSDPAHCSDPTDAMFARPDHLEFCTEPTPCADQSNFPMACLSEPETYYVLPFNKSFRWAGERDKHLITDVSVTVDICDGCGEN